MSENSVKGFFKFSKSETTPKTPERLVSIKKHDKITDSLNNIKPVRFQ